MLTRYRPLDGPSQFGKLSLSQLANAHPDLQRVLYQAAAMGWDFTVTESYRDASAQNIAFLNNNSNVRFPHSLHNHLPSLAVDIAPWDAKSKKILWKDALAFALLAGGIYSAARSVGVEVKWGGHDTLNRGGSDAPHWELVQDA